MSARKCKPRQYLGKSPSMTFYTSVLIFRVVSLSLLCVHCPLGCVFSVSFKTLLSLLSTLLFRSPGLTVLLNVLIQLPTIVILPKTLTWWKKGIQNLTVLLGPGRRIKKEETRGTTLLTLYTPYVGIKWKVRIRTLSLHPY